ncbi:protein of unknown function [Bradyrhizobium vignae]|uniref:Uncharacterized protein n=1 Tax=Bradyrhizobium vignae TaxID=1549949 RepID=A0A2U3Q7Y6_9BRAD|nr:protein of unknown function [Bradyrhizobium vignae]
MDPLARNDWCDEEPSSNPLHQEPVGTLAFLEAGQRRDDAILLLFCPTSQTSARSGAMTSHLISARAKSLIGRGLSTVHGVVFALFCLRLPRGGKIIPAPA